MDRFPVIVVLGAAVLGRVGGEMIMTDPWVKTTFGFPHWLDYVVQAVLAVGVVLAGKWFGKRKKQQSHANRVVGPGTPRQAESD
jgi:predicted tellurium resistance membrane protein TerC